MADVGYVVKYGRGSYLGRFALANGDKPARGSRVLVRTSRGLEIGEILCAADDQFAAQVGGAELGEVIRLVSITDEEDDRVLQGRGEMILADAQQAAEGLGLPLALLDVEVLFDGSTAILHAIHWAECDATPLFDQLSQSHGLSVKLHDDTRREAVHAGCGKPGCGAEGGGCSSCGSEGGGCSTGGCSRGSVKSAEELTAYFAGLRAQMEAHTHRHPLA